jgi:DNA polymerase III alpha subunit (gram-positive type)
MYLFVDTETNGKIKNFSLKPSETTLDNFPRVSQLAFALYDKNCKIVEKNNFYIHTDGWTIPNERFFIDNGMSTEKYKELGIPISKALDIFVQNILNSQFIIAHNIDFDYPTIACEMIRAKVKAGRILPKICTMKGSMHFCDLPGGRYGEPKYPKLEELHKKLFDAPIEDAHDALGDVLTTAKCFFELRKRGIL